MTNTTEGTTEGPDDGAPLGAAATRSLKGDGAAASKAGSSKTRTKRKLPGGLLVLVVIVGALLLALVPAGRTALVKTPRDRVGISYGGGPIEGVHFQKIVQPGSNLFFNGIFDSLYLYPADQRSYVVGSGTDADADGQPTTDAITAPSRDRVQVTFQVAMYYKLNTNELRAFHEELGLRYSAYTSQGWDRLITETFRPQVESAIQEETRRYDVADLYGDAEQLETIQASVQSKLVERLERSLGQQFFCGPDFRDGGECSEVSFVIKRIDVPDSVVAAFEANRTSEIAILTKQNEIAQREAEAEAINVLGEALAQSGDQYVLLKAIESGQIGFWALPSDSGVTLQTPETGPSTSTPGN